MTATCEIKCVACGHRAWIPLPTEQPFCAKCFSPVVVLKVKAS